MILILLFYQITFSLIQNSRFPSNKEKTLDALDTVQGENDFLRLNLCFLFI